MSIKLSGATITRIKEELARMNAAMGGQWATDQWSPHHSIGDDHRAIEDFVTVLLEEILPKEREKAMGVPPL